jgi:hypothetical protein
MKKLSPGVRRVIWAAVLGICITLWFLALQGYVRSAKGAEHWLSTPHKSSDLRHRQFGGRV